MGNNPVKTQALFISRKTATRNLPNNNSLMVANVPVKWSENVKYLGMLIDRRLTFKDHINYSIEKFNKTFKLLYSLLHRKSKLSITNKLLLYILILRSLLIYASPVWFNSAKTHIKKLQVAQNKCLKIIYDKPWLYSTKKLSKISDVPLVIDQIIKIRKKFKYKLCLVQNSIINQLIL